MLRPAHYIIECEPFRVHNKYINRWQVLYCEQRVTTDLFNDQTKRHTRRFFCFSPSVRLLRRKNYTHTLAHTNNKIACNVYKSDIFFFHFPSRLSFCRRLRRGISLALRNIRFLIGISVSCKTFFCPNRVINLRERDTNEYNVSPKQIERYT